MKTKISRPVLIRQKGLTLVELMVSITIGLLIMLFISSLFISSRGSQRMVDDNMRIQQDGQAALYLMGRSLMQARFGHMLPNATYTDFTGQGLHGCNLGFTTATTFVTDTLAACATAASPPAFGTGTPVFEVSYRVDDTVNASIGAGTDCNGQQAPVNADGKRIAVNRFFLAVPNGETLPSLYCAGNGSNVAQPLLGNVQTMHLTYGIDTDNDRSPDRFETSATVVDGLNADWSQVVSVRVCLEIVSPNAVTPSAQTYVDCAGVQRTATDRRLRTVLSNVFALRNNAVAKPAT